MVGEVFHFQSHVVEETAIPFDAALVTQLDCQSEEQLLFRRIGSKCRRKTQSFHGSLTVRTTKGIKGFFSFIDIVIDFSSLNIGKNKSDRDFTRKYLSLCCRYEIVGSGLDKFTQSIIDDGYSDNQPFSNMRDDKNHKGNRHHLDCFCSCADSVTMDTYTELGFNEALEDFRKVLGIEEVKTRTKTRAVR